MNCRTLLCHRASVLLSPISHVVASRYTASSDAIMKQYVDICTSLPCIWPYVYTDIVSRMNYIKTVNQNKDISFTCIHLKISTAKGRLFCPGEMSYLYILIPRGLHPTPTPPLRQSCCYVLIHRKTRNLDGLSILSIFVSCFGDLTLGR